MKQATTPFLRNLLTAAALAVFAASAAAGNPDVVFFLTAKGQHFMQTNSGVPVLDTTGPAHAPYRFIANVEPGGTGTILDAVLRRPNGSIITMTNENAGDNQFEIEAQFATKPLLDAAFPAGNYVFYILTTNSGQQTATNMLPADNYPTNAPRIINWAALQSVIVTDPLQVEWEAFLGGTTNDFVQLMIESDNGDEVYFSGEPNGPESLNGTSTSVLVPAGRLTAGSNYHATLLFAKLGPPNLTDIPGATGIAAYYKETRFSVVGGTTPPAAGRFLLASATYTASETQSGGSVTVTVLRGGGSSGPASVRVSTRDGTATAASGDYESISSVVNWGDGEGGVGPGGDVTIRFPYDTRLDGNETFFVTLSDPTGGADLGLPIEAMVTIIDDEIRGAGILQFSLPMFMAIEATTNVAITVTRTGGATGQVSVIYTTTPDSAEAVSDFNLVAGVLVFSNGVTSRTINVPLVADNLDETNESFTIRIDSPFNGAALGANTAATVVIKDDDTAGALAFGAAMYPVSESTNGSRASVIIRRTGGFADAVSVDLVITGGSAELDEDYSHAGGDTVTLQFIAGQLAITNIFEIGDDNEPETTEDITLQIRYPAGGARLAGITNSTIKILDNEVTLQFSAGFYTNRENVAVAIVFVERGGPVTDPASVNVYTEGGSAGPDADYVPILATNTLNFTPGLRRKPVGVRIINDFLVEDTETIGLHLANPSPNAQLGPRSDATLFVTSEDAAGKFQFAALSANVLESRPVVPIIITRTMGLASNVTVRLSTTDILSATAGLDYHGTNVDLAFGPREVRKTVNIPIIPDGLAEGNETFEVTLDNPTGGAEVVGRSTQTVVILDNDLAGMIGFSSAEYVVNEVVGDNLPPTNGVRVVVTRIGGTASNVTVRLKTADGTATNGLDYTGIDTVLTFAAGELSKTNLIPILNDTLPEAATPETISLSLSDYRGGGKPTVRSNATIRIVDDESSVSFTNDTATATESRIITVTVLRGGALNSTGRVDFMTMDGTALAGVNYRATNGTLVFPPNVPSKTFTIAILNSTETNAGQTFSVFLKDPQGVLLGMKTNITFTMADAPDPNAVPLAGPEFFNSRTIGVTNLTFSRTFNVTEGSLSDVYLENVIGNNYRIGGFKAFTSPAGSEMLTLGVNGLTGPGTFVLTRAHLQADASYIRGTFDVANNFAYAASDEGTTGVIIIDGFNGTAVSGRFDIIISDDADQTKWVRSTGSFRALSPR